MESGRDLIERISGHLHTSGVDKYEARVIAEYVTGDSFSDLQMNAYDLSTRQNDQLDDLIAKRNSGIPLPYVLKSAPFRHLDLYVDERVLIPRSETEIVVEHAIELLKDRGEQVVVDMCTGSGAIALSIAQEVIDSHVYASDISSDALDVARLNSVATGSPARRVQYFCGDLFDALPESIKGTVNVIVSNPPYIGEEEKADVESTVVNHEPHVALFAGAQGTDIYERLIDQARDWVAHDGYVVLEISPSTAEFVQECARTNGYGDVEVFPDMTGRKRVAVLRYAR